MKLFIQAPIEPQPRLLEIDVLPDLTIYEIKQQICEILRLNQSTMTLMYGEVILDDSMIIAAAGIPENAQLTLIESIDISTD